ncbi:homeobox protein DTH-1-like [Bolinopsis microptera]|uniref:homeobox protein DTH-1-like n=1 Tax=Bolinopsis microptera TaxID=2820187 RepID=UPI00307A7A13
MSGQSGLGAFSIDNLLGRNKSKPQKQESRNTRGCCGCPLDKHLMRGFNTDKCRCRCHESQRQQQLSMSSTFGQKERKRTTFTEIQNKGMRNIFDHKRYLDGGERDEIAKQFNLTPAQVKRKWQNFRAKDNKTVQTTMFSTGFSNHSYGRSLSYSAAAQPYVKPNSSYNDRLMSSNNSSTLHGNNFLSHNLRLNANTNYLGKDLGLFGGKTTKPAFSTPTFNLGWSFQ